MTSTLNPPYSRIATYSAKVNRLLSCGHLYGQFFRQPRLRRTEPAPTTSDRAGWVILTGDRLVVTMTTLTPAAARYGVVTFDGVTVRDHITASRLFIIAAQHRGEFRGITGTLPAS